MKDHLRESKVLSDDKELKAMHEQLYMMSQSFFLDGSKKLVKRWSKFIEAEGDIVKKLCYS